MSTASAGNNACFSIHKLLMDKTCFCYVWRRYLHIALLRDWNLDTSLFKESSNYLKIVFNSTNKNNIPNTFCIWKKKLNNQRSGKTFAIFFFFTEHWMKFGKERSNVWGCGKIDFFFFFKRFTSHCCVFFSVQTSSAVSKEDNNSDKKNEYRSVL